ncbi:UNVERIFIED_CONTAM: Potassium voltage-gated channel sub H member 7 [Siphonaria sp. JEL0065]|nr:Potassium voltage-gated channel sub H member 7 [Siphonaria sp. JEL0065]
MALPSNTSSLLALLAHESYELQTNLQTLQSNFQALQSQVIVGVTRINKLTDLCVQLGVGITPAATTTDPKRISLTVRADGIPDRLIGRKPGFTLNASVDSFVKSPSGMISPKTNVDFNRYQYHDPVQELLSQGSINIFGPDSLARTVESNDRSISIMSGQSKQFGNLLKAEDIVPSQSSLQKGQLSAPEDFGIVWDSTEYTVSAADPVVMMSPVLLLPPTLGRVRSASLRRPGAFRPQRSSTQLVKSKTGISSKNLQSNAGISAYSFSRDLPDKDSAVSRSMEKEKPRETVSVIIPPAEKLEMPLAKPNLAELSPELYEQETFTQRFLFSSFQIGGAASYDLLCDEKGKYGLFITGIHIHSPFSSVLNLFFIGLYFLAVFFVPYHAAYYNIATKPQAGLMWSISVLFSLDSLLNYFTPPLEPIKSSQHYRSPQTLPEWQRYYLWNYAVIDAITVVPWTELITNEYVYFALSLLVLLRMIRLPFKIGQNSLCESVTIKIRNIAGIGTILTRVMNIGVVLIIFIHIQACVLYFLGRIQDFSGWDTQFTHWNAIPGGIGASSAQDRYIWMISQSIGNIFQLTFKPETNNEQIATFIFIAAGATLYATIVGLISSAAISFDAPGKLYRQRIDELKEYLNWKEIDNSTKKKLLDYYEFKYRGKYFEEVGLLGDLNESLRRVGILVF